MERIPKAGEVWHWYPDESGCDTHYGPGVVLGFREGWVIDDELFVTLMFESGVLNMPIKMVERFMYLAQES